MGKHFRDVSQRDMGIFLRVRLWFPVSSSALANQPPPGLLVQFNGLLPVSRIDQRIHVASIPANFPNKSLPNSELDHHGCRHLLHHLDRLLQYLCLHTCQGILDQGEGYVHKPVCHVVHQCRNQHHDRFCHYSFANTCHSRSKLGKEAKDWTHFHLCSWWFVSSSFS